MTTKSKENFDMIKSHFDIPITFEHYMNGDHIFVCETFVGDSLAGVSILNIRDRVMGNIDIPVDFKPPICHINYTLVDEDFRNIGIGRGLKQCILDFAKSKGCGVVSARIEPSNYQSIRSIMSMGFVKNNKTDSGGMNTYYKLI